MEVLEKNKVVPKVEAALLVEEDVQIVIHCMISSIDEVNGIRIWPTTFIRCRKTGVKVKLAHFENISLYPHWTFIPADKNHVFTLIFKGLPKNCMAFDLVEEIPQPGGFEFMNIQRNETDVYRIILE